MAEYEFTLTISANDKEGNPETALASVWLTESEMLAVADFLDGEYTEITGNFSARIDVFAQDLRGLAAKDASDNG